VPTAISTKLRRKRCLNCNKPFTPKRNVIKKAKFCKDACRKEFWKHGSSFGPIKVGLYAAIDKKYAALEKEANRRHRAFMGEVADQSRRIDQLEKDLASLRDEHEGHRHQYERANTDDYYMSITETP
jgi:hypothetical protein